MKATLPTEAQWEYACRAETNTAYSYGNSADSKKMNYDSTATEPAKSYAPNHWGLYDMHGNVWEWTSDYYAKAYPKETAIDPKGPDVAVLRVERGGSWFNKLEGSCRSADRSRSVPDSRVGNLGFRFVLICD
jgi:formylglycine-generating enzyme required for sulfatase activity